MPAPYNWGAPVRRPGSILTCTHNGSDSDLIFTLTFLNAMGNNSSRDLTCSTATTVGQLCLPSSAVVTDLEDETCISHARMAGWIHGGGVGLIPGSTEWLAMFQDEGAIPDFQMAIGNVRIYAARIISEVEFEFDLRKKGTSNPTKTVRTDFGVFLDYDLDPSEAIRCISGGVEYLHPTYVHNPATGTYLTSTQKDQVCTSILADYGANGLNAPWM